MCLTSSDLALITQAPFGGSTCSLSDPSGWELNALSMLLLKNRVATQANYDIKLNMLLYTTLLKIFNIKHIFTLKYAEIQINSCL